jgi:hypothetical protein
VLLNRVDLLLRKLSKSKFDSLTETIKDIKFKKDDVYKAYMSIIDTPEKNPECIFIMNLFELLKSNDHESFFSKTVCFETTENKKGGMRFRDLAYIDYLSGGKLTIHLMTIFISLQALNSLLGNPMDLSLVIATTIILGFSPVKQMLIDNRTGIPALRGYFESESNFFNLYNCKLNQVSDYVRVKFSERASRRYAESLQFKKFNYEDLKRIIVEFQTRRGYLESGNGFVDEVTVMEPEMVQEPDFTDDELLSYLMVIDGRIEFTDQGKERLSGLTQQQITRIMTRLAPYIDRGNGINANQKERFKMRPGLIARPANRVEVKRVKMVQCPICSKNFCYNKDDEYIHEQVTEADITEELETMDVDVRVHLRPVVTAQMRHYSKLNIFPCKQLIDSLSPEKLRDPCYAFNSQFGEPSGTGTYGNKLLCSNCFLESLSSLEETTWPLYVGARADNDTFDTNFNLVEEVVSHLSTNELSQLDPEKYISHSLMCIKFKQMKETNDVREKVLAKFIKDGIPEHERDVNAQIVTVTCRHCTVRNIGRLCKVLTRDSPELLSLHCTTCSRNYNGHDYAEPYVLKIEQYERLLKSQDVASFLESERTRSRRRTGMARVNMNAFKRIKEREICQRYENDYNNPKKCPQCKLSSILESGCSSMTCSQCNAFWCYVCGQQLTESHQANHYLRGIDLPQPYGSVFGIQCVNVNFTVVAPDGSNGIHHSRTDIQPNRRFEDTTRVLWLKHNFLLEEYRRRGIDILTQDDIWNQLDSLFYDPERDRIYRMADGNDPRFLMEAEIAQFMTECDSGNIQPVMNASLVDETDIEEHEYADTPDTDADEIIARRLQEQINMEDPVGVRSSLNDPAEVRPLGDRAEVRDRREVRPLLDLRSSIWGRRAEDVREVRPLGDRAEDVRDRREDVREVRPLGDRAEVRDRPAEVRPLGDRRAEDVRGSIWDRPAEVRPLGDRAEVRPRLRDNNHMTTEGVLQPRYLGTQPQPRWRQPYMGRTDIPLLDHRAEALARPLRDRPPKNINQALVRLMGRDNNHVEDPVDPRAHIDQDEEIARRRQDEEMARRRQYEEDEDMARRLQDRVGGGSSNQLDLNRILCELHSKTNNVSPLLELVPMNDLTGFNMPENFKSYTPDEQIKIIKANIELLKDKSSKQNEERYIKLLSLLKGSKSNDKLQSAISFVEQNKTSNVQLPYDTIPVIREQIGISIICRTIESLKKQRVTHVCIYSSEFGYLPLFKLSDKYTCLNYFDIDFVPNDKAMKLLPVEFNSLHNIISEYNKRFDLMNVHTLTSMLNNQDSLKYMFEKVKGGKKTKRGKRKTIKHKNKLKKTKHKNPMTKKFK